MTFDEFMALTEAQRWRAVFDAVLAEVRSPKYDTALYTKAGRFWASECNESRLEFEIKRAEESAAGGGQYADKDAKKANALRFFLAWRKRNPSTCWTGERDRMQVTAKAPSQKPEATPRDAQRAPDPAPSSGANYSDEDYGADDSDIQF